MNIISRTTSPSADAHASASFHIGVNRHDEITSLPRHSGPVIATKNPDSRCGTFLEPRNNERSTAHTIATENSRKAVDPTHRAADVACSKF